MGENEPGPLLGIGKEAEVFAFGTQVVKLYRPRAGKAAAFSEAAILAMVEGTGLPTPAVSGVCLFGDRWGVVMARADGPPFATAMDATPALVPEYLATMAELHRAIHAQALPQLGSLKRRLARSIGRAPLLTGADRDRLLARLDALPHGDALCHGDFHPFNVIGRPGVAMIVDWLDATYGDPAADVARSFVLMQGFSPELAAAYVDAYVAQSNMARTDIEAWVQVVAAARLAERVPAEEKALLEMAGEARQILRSPRA